MLANSALSGDDVLMCRGNVETLGLLANIPCTGAMFVEAEGISQAEVRERPMRSLNKFDIELVDDWLRMGPDGTWGSASGGGDDIGGGWRQASYVRGWIMRRLPCSLL